VACPTVLNGEKFIVFGNNNLMANYISLYRKYRPQTFEEVVGQKHIVQTLKNAVTFNRISHAYLFAGPKGTGKTTVARLFAKALNCLSGPTPEPCGQCEMCRKIAVSQAIDVFEIDAASNRGIDEIRQLREGINFVPVEARFKVYIIDEVHMLTDYAFNALLKTLEEPPGQTVFILATTQPEKIPATILSRVQQLDFRKIPDEEVIVTLEKISQAEKVNSDKAVFGLIANQAKGSLRDALSLFDELIAYKNKNISVEDVRFLVGAVDEEFLEAVFEAMVGRDYAGVFNLLDRALAEGRNFTQVLLAVADYFRQLLFAKLGEGASVLKAKAEKVSLDFIKKALQELSAAFMEIRIHPQPQLYLELAFLEIIENAPVPVEKPDLSSAVAPAPVRNSSENHSLMEIKQRWSEALEKIRQKSYATFILVNEGILADIENEKIILKYKKGFSFYREKLREDEISKLVAEVLEDVFGKGVRLEIVLENTSEVAEEPTLNKKVPPSRNFEDNQIARAFGGKVIQSKKE
jgi:DNA polymerase-3 subunit gamma/tau